MVEISLLRLLLMAIPVLGVLWLMKCWSGDVKEPSIAVVRMVVQLLLMGYVLVFVFGNESWFLQGVIIAFMITISSWIAIRTVKKQRWRAFLEALLAITVGGGSVFVLVLVGVLQTWQPRYSIPLAGMIFANAMTALTLALERFESERAHGQPLLEARRLAWNAALIPQINSFLAVGLVSLPGMMTGQILAGASPLGAVRYQILVMAMVLCSAAYAVAIFLRRRVRFERKD